MDTTQVQAVPWATLFNVLWPGPHAIYRDDQVAAFEASVAARVPVVPGDGDIACALQAISESQRSGDGIYPRDLVPTPTTVVSQILRTRFERQQGGSVRARERVTRMLGYQERAKAAASHDERWDLICEVGEYARGGSTEECRALHRWVCAVWTDFPVGVIECRERFGGLANAPREAGAVAPSLHADVGTVKGEI